MKFEFDDFKFSGTEIGDFEKLSKEFNHLAREMLRDAWQPVETFPMDIDGTVLVANKRGQVAPWIRGVIHSNVPNHDWEHGEAITHWMPLPAPPRST